jgi:hypothetical protein
LLASLQIVGKGGGGGGRRGKRLDTRYAKVAEFGGGMAEWSDWAFSFKRAIRLMDVECHHIMEKVEKVNPTVTDFDERLLNDYVENGDCSAISGELYDLLCTVVKGEALMILKGVDEYQGFKAWSKLYAKYNPKTTARAIKLLSEICSPGVVKSAHEVDGAVQRWKSKLRLMEKEFDEKLGERMNIAILTAMMPPHIQDHIFQTVNDSIDFDTMVGKISSWVANRVAMEGGVPMDVGEVGEKWDWGGYEEEEEYGYGGVAAVSAWTRCNACSGYGHIARDCPSKGKGKGKEGNYKGNGKGYSDYAKGKGKDGGKGDFGKNGGGKGYSDYAKGKGKDGSKGFGKGYQGTCWKCGVVGHKIAECTKWVHEVEGTVAASSAEKPVEEVSVGGGVWMIGAVESEFKKAVNTVRAKMHIEKGKVTVGNMFQDLAEDRDDDEDVEPDAMRGSGAGSVTEEGSFMGECSKLMPQPRGGDGHGDGHGGDGHVSVAFGVDQMSYEERLKYMFDKVGTAKLWSSEPGDYAKKTLEGHNDDTTKLKSCDPGERLKTLKGDGHDTTKPWSIDNGKRLKDPGASPRGACMQHFVGGGGGEMCDDASCVKVGINAVSTSPPGLGRTAAMRFHVAPVQRPLASAVKVVQAGNRIMMSSEGSYIENVRTGEKMPLRVERGTFVFDVTFSGGQDGTITLDSGAGVNVWPESLLKELPMGPPDTALRMTAANGTSIPSSGTKVVEFKARSPGFTRHA